MWLNIKFDSEQNLTPHSSGQPPAAADLNRHVLDSAYQPDP